MIAQSGSFEFILTVTDSLGLNDSTSTIVSVNAAPIASLVADKISGVAPLTATFDSSASSDDVSITKRDYEFAPNVFALNAGNSVSYTYNTPGDYQAKVRIFDGENLVSEAVVTITVSAPQVLTPPIAWFLIDIDPDSLEVRLRNKAEKGSSNLTSVRYELNGASIGESAIYDYSEVTFQGEFGSTYQIRQIVTDEQNQSDDQIFTIVLDPDTQKPIANFRIAQSNALEVFVDATRSFDPFDQIANIQINWGDNSPVETLDSLFINHNYQTAGTYSVTLRVETESGLFATRTRQITVTDEATEALLPIANFNVEYEEHAKHVRLFSQYSGSPNGELLSFFWEYGDGQVGYGEQSVHFYSVGVYYARLTVTDSMNLRASQVQQIIITEEGPPIISSVSCDSYENFATCDFFAAHKDKQLDRVEINWGDSSPLQTIAATNSEWEIFSNINHQYQSAGTYTISIRAVTSTNLDYTHQTEVEVLTGSGGNFKPIADLNCVATLNKTVNCSTSGSFDPDGFITNIVIYMGDGASYSGFSDIIHTYAYEGQYQVMAVVTDNLGDSTTVFQLLTIFDGPGEFPAAEFTCQTNGFLISCDGSESYDPNGAPLSFSWYLDGIKVSSTNSLSYEVANEGAYSIILVVSNPDGKEGSRERVIDIANNPLDIVVADIRCYALTLNLIQCDAGNSTGNNIQFNWFINDEQQLENTYELKREFTTLGKKKIEVLVSNHLFTKRAVAEVSLDYITPSADFNYSQIGDIIRFDANNSLLNNRFIKSYQWRIVEDNRLENSFGPEISFNFEEVQNKTLELTVTDFLDATSTISKYIEGDINQLNISFEIAHDQPEGGASRTVDFSIIDIENPSQTPITYTWEIDGQIFNGESLSHTFLSRGLKTIKVTATGDNGAIAEKNL